MVVVLCVLPLAGKCTTGRVGLGEVSILQRWGGVRRGEHVTEVGRG